MLLISEIEQVTEVSTTEEFEKTFEMVTEKINNLKQELTDQRAEADVEEKKTQALVDESRDALVSILHSTSNVYKQTAHN